VDEMKDSIVTVLAELASSVLRFPVYGLLAFIYLFIGSSSQMYASSNVYQLPEEITSDRFTVAIDGKSVAIAHAAENYYFLNFDLVKNASVSITAPSEDYWAKGVEVQPWRENIRPVRHGRTITFTVGHPCELSITRPGDYLGGAEMLFLFANKPEVKPPTSGSSSLRYYGPGVYHENIDAESGDSIYLAPGAVIFGSINIWGVDNVKIFGRGIVVYDGPQNPADDDGWIHRRNWHVIVMDNAHHIDISGITCVTRSRTWMIQMKSSRFITFDNVKVIGGSAGNANQDGMDWLGGGDTVVRDTFIRAADDVFALQGNWDGYGAEEMARPGEDVSNIRIENSVLSTSISNIVRVNWPHKTFNSSNFVLQNSDVIHIGAGGCVVPFALFELWADPDGRGMHTGYRFENIRMDDWYSLVQIRQPNPAVRDVRFKDIWALDSLARVPSVLKGDVDDVHFENVKVAGRIVERDADLPLLVLPEAKDAIFDKGPVGASFQYKPLAPKPKQEIRFEATASNGASYQWFFGDGSSAKGRVVRHAMPDEDGTLLDGSGRFRVLLKVTDRTGRVDWASNTVVIRKVLDASLSVPNLAAGLSYQYYDGSWASLPDFSGLKPVAIGSAETISADAHGHADNYGFVFDGYVKVPIDGGYTFNLVSRDGGLVEVDGKAIATSPAVWPQVCGSVGNAVQSASGSVGLKAGLHHLRVAMTQKTGEDAFALHWQGPGMTPSPIPAEVLFHGAALP
jgi:PA14 domain